MPMPLVMRARLPPAMQVVTVRCSLWKRRSRVHQLLCRFVALLGKPALAFLQDHAVSGRRLLPATAMLEAAAEACGVLLDGADTGAGSALRDTSFLSAFVLNR